MMTVVKSFQMPSIRFLVLLWVGFLSCCTPDKTIIVPEEGYQWPEKQREYWPTDGWETASMDEHNINLKKMNLADQFARNDSLTRALLVVKDGYLVFEKYYDDGGIDQSTNLWSVTKSITSALVGISMDQNSIQSTDQLMADLMPDYSDFNSITLDHVLTHTTGLAWSETGPRWTRWISSQDWVAAALERGQRHRPGKEFYYSSANSHFLTALIYHRTGLTPGVFAKDNLFDPLGIPFEPLVEEIVYENWDDYIVPLPQSWRQDPTGIETGGFCLYLTARDMAKYGFLFLNRGLWDGKRLISEQWVEVSTKDQVTDIYGRYSYGYHWWISLVADRPSFLASGLGGQIIGIVPSLDLVVVIKYEAEQTEHPKPGSAHDDMYLFELVAESVE
ncbi:MAG: serine hydrolase [Proteobacteria bacterium]|nr:serine hydrolase [Pseudomonadota bacterium]